MLCQCFAAGFLVCVRVCVRSAGDLQSTHQMWRLLTVINSANCHSLSGFFFFFFLLHGILQNRKKKVHSDADTTGLMVVCRTDEAMLNLGRQFHDRQVREHPQMSDM
jgi:hypothetical protein